LKRLLEPLIPKIVVVSPSEIPPAIPVQSLGSVR
jgi:flagellar biosynthesis protein FlhA